MAEILGRYSNLSTAGAKAAKAHAIAQQERRLEPWQSPELQGATRVRQVVTSQIDQIVADYHAGMGCVLLARKYHLAENTVLEHLKAAGVAIRQPHRLTEEEAIELTQLRADGWSLRELADRFGVSKTSVSRRLSRLRPVGDPAQ